MQEKVGEEKTELLTKEHLHNWAGVFMMLDWKVSKIRNTLRGLFD